MEEMIRDTDETSYQNSGRKEQREERDNFSGLMKTRESTDPGSTLCPTREDGEPSAGTTATSAPFRPGPALHPGHQELRKEGGHGSDFSLQPLPHHRPRPCLGWDGMGQGHGDTGKGACKLRWCCLCSCLSGKGLLF